MTTNLTRRGLLGAFIAAPAIVRASSLMKLPRPEKTFELIINPNPLLRDFEEFRQQLNYAWANYRLQPDILIVRSNFSYNEQVARLNNLLGVA